MSGWELHRAAWIYLAAGVSAGIAGGRLAALLPRWRRWPYIGFARAAVSCATSPPVHLGHLDRRGSEHPLARGRVLAAVTRVWFPAVCGLVSIVFGYRLGLNLAWALTQLAATLLLVAMQVDAKYRILPDALIGPVLLVGAALVLNSHGRSPAGAILGSVLGFGALFLANLVSRRVRGVPMFGKGDLKLMGAAGACLGVKGIAIALDLAGLAFVVLSVLLPRGEPDRRDFPSGIVLVPAVILVWVSVC